MDKARELWNQILQRGFANQAQSWMEYFNLERYFASVITILKDFYFVHECV